MNNDQFIADGMVMLKGKVNLEKLKSKLDKISSDITDDYAVDEMERVLSRNGYETIWEQGYRII